MKMKIKFNFEIKYLIIIVCLFFIFSVISIFQIKKTNFKDKKENSNVVIACPAPNQKIKIAVCPTFYNDLKNIETDKFEIILTNSTKESLVSLGNKRVDIVLAGRTLLPNEKKFKSETVNNPENYYSFLSDQETEIYTDDFSNHKFYTDLDVEKVRKDLDIKEVSRVDNVYEYLDKGVIISSWGNTDYNRAKIVHVLNPDKSRLKISRLPVIYYQSGCEKHIINELKKNL